MIPQKVVYHYHQHALEGTYINRRVWLKVDQIYAPLGFPSKLALNRLFNRHSDEFTEEETLLSKVPTRGGKQESRLFSLQGARLLAVFARTEPAKPFRRWIMGVLDGKIQRHVLRDIQPSLPGTHMLATEARRALQDVSLLIEPDHPAQIAIAQMIDGSLPLSVDLSLEELGRREKIVKQMESQAGRARAALRQDTKRMSYTPEAVKRAAALLPDDVPGLLMIEGES